MNCNLTLYTIGAYGRDARSFFAALETHRIDVFVDVRDRRGMRGAQYAWANRARLEASLAERGIAYLHLKATAPPKDLRDLQDAADRATRTPKRRRSGLSAEFIAAYRDRILASADRQALRATICNAAGANGGSESPRERRAALFCVEAEPAACHRSLLAEFIVGGAQVIHL